MKVYAVTLHIRSKISMEDTLKVFHNKQEALKYEELLLQQIKNGWEFTECVEREVE